MRDIPVNFLQYLPHHLIINAAHLQIGRIDGWAVTYIIKLISKFQQVVKYWP